MHNGEDAECDVYSPVTDHLGRPVVVVNSLGEVSGVGEYESYGMMNRADAWDDTGHPYANGASKTMVDQDFRLLGMKLDARAHFNQLDTEAVCGGGLYDWAVVMDGDTETEVTPRAGGAKQGDAWTAWGKIPGGKVMVRFVSDGANCAPGDCSCQQGTSYPYSGATLKELEVRRYQSTSWYFPPLRFPGQYFDAETDLHENWNRFYDPQTGRYWAGDPLLLASGYLRDQALAGVLPSSYVYTRGNPVNQSDASGLRTPNIPGGMSGKLCVSQSCKRIPPGKSVCKPEDDGPLESLPNPGECKEVDGLYSSAGTWKIPDNCTCHILCDASGNRTGGEGMLCACLPVPGRSREQQRPQWSREPVLGWPKNPLLAQ